MSGKSFNISVDIVGERELLEALGTVEKGMLNLNQLGVWKRVQSVFYKTVTAIFESGGGASAAGQWAPLSSKYAAVKNRLYGGPTRVLIASGGMYRSLTSPGGNAVVEMGPQEATFGSRDPKSRWHNDGSGRNPRRPIFEFTEEQKEGFAEPIKEKLKQLVDNAKLRQTRGF